MKHATRRLAGFLSGLSLLALAGATPGLAGNVNLPGVGGFLSVPVVSLKEARFQTVIKQQYDFSCGSAALATLLTYHYERPTTEQDVFQAMFETGDQELIRAKGFSLLDMKSYLEGQGLQADGFRVKLDQLAEARIPAIVLIEIRGYRHFVLVKGLSDAEVLVGDPAFGVKVYKRAAFEPLMVSDIIFVIRDEPEVAQAHFNDQREWAVRVKAPFGTALSRESLASFTLHLPGRNEF